MRRRRLNAFFFLRPFLVLGIAARLAHASPGTEGASFLDIPVGAGPAAMGSAYSALATDAYAPVYNPAGLAFLPVNQLAGQHLDYLESVHHEFVSAAVRSSEGQAFAVSAQYLGSGDITGRNSSGDPQGDYDVHYGAYSLAYGRTFSPTFALGLTGKFIEAKISDVGSTAYAVDVGSLWQVRPNFDLAAVVTNIGSKLTFLNDGQSLPLTFHLGVAYKPIPSWTLSGEAIYPKTGLAGLRTGVEWHPVPVVSLRTGYRTETTRSLGALAGFSTGLGLHLWGHEFSYAWTPYGELGSAQYFSLLVRFGPRGQENLSSRETNP